MIPVWLFVAIVALWVAYRMLTWLLGVLVENRSEGFQLLMMLGGIAFGLPPLLNGNLVAAPFVLLAAYVAWWQFDLLRPFRWIMSRWSVHRRVQPPDNVVPLRSS